MKKGRGRENGELIIDNEKWKRKSLDGIYRILRERIENG